MKQRIIAKKEQQEQESVKILLRTMTNGYVLDVDGEGYMYYNVQELLEGFFIHIGMRRLKAMTKKEIKALVSAVKEGSALRKLQAEVNELSAQLKDCKKEIRTLKMRIREME